LVQIDVAHATVSNSIATYEALFQHNKKYRAQNSFGVYDFLKGVYDNILSEQ